MRLIDADKIGLTDFEIAMCNGDYKEALTMLLDKIPNQPTACDISNIVEELEKAKTISVDIGFGTIIDTIRKDVVLEIVKHGGVSDDVCEWKIFDNSLTEEPQLVYETTCGKYVGEEHTSKAFVYCPYCSKKIKEVE